MASNIEDFLIRFKFADKKFVGELKKVASQIDKIETNSAKAGRKQQQRSRQNTQALTEEMKIQRKLNALKRSSNFKLLQEKNPRMAVNKLAEAQSLLNRRTEKGREAFKDLKTELGNTARSYRQVERRAISLKTAQRGLTDSTRNMLRAYVSMFALFEGTQAINRIGQDFEGMRAAMLASSGGSKQAAKDLAFVRKEAVRLGLDLRDATDNFVKFQFAAKGLMSQQDTRALFTGFSEFATALQLSPQRFDKSLTALQQMMNKGQIMAEELKQQLNQGLTEVSLAA